MSVWGSSVRPGAYRDSIVLMQLQAALAELPGVEDAGAVMGTPENLALLADASLLSEPRPEVRPSDLLIAIRAESAAAAGVALARAEEFFKRDGARRGPRLRPRSVAAAAGLLPEARFALVSVPGRYAAGVAREALDRGLHVFLYSDNVPLQDEVELKRSAAERGLIVMGPDCGTGLIGGTGFGFANRVRRGNIGIVAASGTGLQVVACTIHDLGGGISQAIGTGGRDTSSDVQAATALQAMDLLHRDPATEVVVLISKPPAERVADRLLAAADATGKPAVIAFQGLRRGTDSAGIVYAPDLQHAAGLAVELSTTGVASGRLASTLESGPRKAGRRWIGGRKARPLAPFFRGLFSGGTLALEVLHKVRGRLTPLHSNLAVEGVQRLEDAQRSQAHTVIDLGADEFTVGRPHPMIDFELRARRLLQEAAEPNVGMIFLDVILGYGAHADPAAELAGVLARAARPDLGLVALVVGTDEDPQGLDDQAARLEEAGAVVFRHVESAVGYALERLGVEMDSSSAEPEPDGLKPISPTPDQPPPTAPGPAVDLAAFEAPIAAINIGLEVFGESLATQGADVVQVDWRPPAGGDARLMEILKKLGR